MFDEMVESTPVKKRRKTGWAFVLSFTLQSIFVGILILVPLIYTEALPKTMLTTFLVAPPPPPPPPPPPAAQPQVQRVRPTARIIQAGKMMAPTAIPKEVKIIKEEALPPDMGVVGVAGGVPGGVPGGQAGGVLGGIIGGVVGSNLPPPPPPKETPQRIRVGGQVQQAKIIYQPKPVYPALARSTRLQGVVRLQAIIAKDGTIQELQVISGPQLLVPAAVEAVRQWRYQPTLLNGEPVEVITTIDVVFSLGG